MAVWAVLAGLKSPAAHICPAGHSQRVAYATSILETFSLALKQFFLAEISYFTFPTIGNYVKQKLHFLHFKSLQI